MSSHLDFNMAGVCAKRRNMNIADRWGKNSWSQWILIALSGGLLTLSFPPIGLYGLIWFALVPFFLFLHRTASAREGFLAGFLLGLVHVSTTMYWISISVYRYGGLPLWGAAALTLLFILYLSLYWGLIGLAFIGAKRIGSPVLFPFAAALVEYIRGLPLIRFPWGGVEMALPPHLAVSQVVDITGIYGLGFLIYLTNYALYRIAVSPKGKRALPALFQGALVLCLLASAWEYGHVRIHHISKEIASWKGIEVSLIQPDIDQSVKWKKSWQVRGLDRYLHLTGEAHRAFHPALVIWPEAALTFYINLRPGLFKHVTDLVRDNHFTLIFGATSYTLKGEKPIFHNSAYLVSPQGKILGRYDKIRLVPFGEYVPFRRWIPFAKNIVGTEEDFTPGKILQPLPSDIGPIGVTICFEGIFPDLSRTLVRKGARLLVNLTNDAWFGRSSGPYQHLRLSAYRAVENRCYLVRSTGTGISAIVDPTGRILGRLPLQIEGILHGIVRLKSGGKTVYTRFGNLFLLCCAVLILAVAVGSWRLRQRQG